jgi:peroxiredoxin
MKNKLLLTLLLVLSVGVLKSQTPREVVVKLLENIGDSTLNYSYVTTTTMNRPFTTDTFVNASQYAYRYVGREREIPYDVSVRREESISIYDGLFHQVDLSDSVVVFHDIERYPNLKSSVIGLFNELSSLFVLSRDLNRYLADDRTSFEFTNSADESFPNVKEIAITIYDKAGKVIPRQMKLRVTQDNFPVSFWAYLEFEFRGVKGSQSQLFQYSDIRIGKDAAPLASLNEFSSFTKREWEPEVIPELLSVGTKAPNWTLKSVGGDSVSLSNFSGKYLLLEFWSANCGHCMTSIGDINELKNKYPLLQVAFISMTGDSESKIKSVVEKQGIKAVMLMKSKSVMADYNVFAYPTFYLVDGSGNIVYSKMGYSKRVMNDIVEILAE